MAPRTPAVADQAFVTLLTNDSYATGALVLAHSLHRVHTTRFLAVLVTSDVSQERREQLSAVFNLVQEVPRLDSEDAENLRLLNRPELGVTFTKINAWTLIQFSKCVFLDADTLVVRNVDDLFDRPELSAAPDVGWPDCFNSGVFVFKPDRSTYRALLEHAKKLGSFDGGDQGLLNSFWSDWACSDPSHRLPFVYNLTVSTSYSYAPALKRFGSEVRIIHFIGSIKPWHHSYSTAADQVILCPGTATTQEPVRKFLNIWWNIYITEMPSPYLVLTPPTPPLSPPHVSSGPYPDPSEPLPEVSVRFSFFPPPPPPSSSSSLSGSPRRDFDDGRTGLPLSNFNSTQPQVLSTFEDLPISDTSEMSSDEVSFGPQAESEAWRASWEQGQIDYMGRDSFDRIQQHIDSLINSTETTASAETTDAPSITDEAETSA